MAFQEQARKARASRDSSVAAVLTRAIPLPDPLPLNARALKSEILTAEELYITALDATAIVTKTSSRELSCEKVINAFLKCAALAQLTLNCVTELLNDHALTRARHLDSHTGPIGPLHGLPISIKEQFGFEGRKNTNSMMAWAGRDQVGTVSIVRRLEALGAIIFARTTQPQTVMHLECNSNLYGRTVNPWNRNLTSGGSSGGEGALVGFGGSILGVGGDIGGSIRCPAGNNGVYGFKPTTLRVGSTGLMNIIAPMDGIVGTIGPLSATLSGIELFMTAYLGTSPWVRENNLLPLPWKKASLPKRLKVAIMWTDGVVQPHPPIVRALREMVDALLKDEDNFEIVEWVPYKHDECWNITSALYLEDGGKTYRDLINEGNEEELPLTQWLLNEPEVRLRQPEEIREVKRRRDAYRAKYNQLWLETGRVDDHPVDAILGPVGPGVAPAHDTARYWSYTSQWNMLDYPAIAFPVGQVDQKLDLPVLDYKPMNEPDRRNHTLYTSPEDFRDAPISLQLVTRRFHDEVCIEVVKRIEETWQSSRAK